MSTNVGSIHYDLKLDTTSFDNASANLKTKINNISDQFEKVGKSMVNTGKTMTAYVTLPIVAGAALAVKGASDLAETMNKVDVAFGDQAKTVREWGNTTLKSIGMAKGTALDAAALFGDMATSMGLSTNEAAKMSMNMVNLAGDLASFKNVGFEQAQTALAGVFTGETESLKRLGIVMTDTNVKAFALSNGFTGNWETASQAEKVTWRYKYVLDVTKNAQGDFARTSQSTANQMRYTTERVKELSTQFGEKLLPILGRLLEFGNRVLDWLGSLTPQAQNAVLAIAGIAAAIGPLLIFLGKIATAIGTLAPLWEALGAALAGTPIGWVILGIAAIIAGIVLLIKYWDQISSAFVKGWNEIQTAIKPVIDFIQGAFKSALDSLKSSWDNLMKTLKPTIDLMVEFYNKHAKEINAVLGVMAGVVAALTFGPIVVAIGLVIGAIYLLIKAVDWIIQGFNWLIKTQQDIANWTNQTWNSIVAYISNALNMIWNAILTVWNAIWGFIQPILNFIWNLFTIIFGSIFLVVYSAIQGIWNIITSIWNAIWGFLQPILMGIWNFIATTWNNIYNSVAGPVSAIWNYVVAIFNMIWGYIAGVLNGILNTARNIWNNIYNTIAGVINNIRNFFGGAMNWLYNAGRNIIEGLWRGISDMAGNVFRKAQEIADGIRDRIRNALNIRSPSKVMIGLGVNIGEGLVIGMEKAMPNINAMADNMANNIGAPVNQLANNTPTGNNSTSVNNNIYGNISLGDQSAVDRFFDKLNRNGELASKGMTTI